MKCKGKNCGATDGVSHSVECFAEHEKTISSCGSAWRPIETAPKNVDVLVFDKNEVYMSCCAVAEQSTDGSWTISDSENDINPSHWMPLPETPNA